MEGNALERTTPVVPAEDLQRQRGYCAALRALNERLPARPRAYVDTYGCQQNEADSELLRGMLVEMGYAISDTGEGADVVILNTCAIREKAETRVFGTLSGKPVAVMQGRMHHYEGYSYETVAYAVRVLRLLGCEALIVTNAAGCVRTDWRAGDLMLITDHIKMFSESPLRGENLPEFGVRFPDASHLYTPRLQDLARSVAAEQGVELREGVYFYCYGPQYETPAEIRAARTLGGDAVGMSTAPEAIVAGHCGMEVLGFTLLSNMAAGILDQPLSEQEVLDAAEAAKPRFSRLILGCLGKL